jgi:hypothetical protein
MRTRTNGFFQQGNTREGDAGTGSGQMREKKLTFVTSASQDGISKATEGEAIRERW